mgnify:CR=1 FL=1
MKNNQWESENDKYLIIFTDGQNSDRSIDELERISNATSSLREMNIKVVWLDFGQWLAQDNDAVFWDGPNFVPII